MTLPNTELINNALLLAKRAHEGQFRRDGKTPYIVHPIRVAEAVVENLGFKFYQEHLIAAALLHDSVEDGNITIDDIRKISTNTGFGIIKVHEIVDIVTKRPQEQYDEYIDRICNFPYSDVLYLKIFDIFDNLNDAPTPQQIKKYTNAIIKIIFSFEKNGCC